MSFLFPLFLAGAAAVGVPILLHLIRRSTRTRVTFSTLMFLRPTPPRFQRRSRLENLPLLLLRCLVVCLLAFAFARPFFPGSLPQRSLRQGRQIVLLIDTSGSMRRADLWTQALEAAQVELEQATPEDRVCVMSFDQTTQTLIGFEEWNQLEADQRLPAVAEHLKELRPSWRGTHLGQALVIAAETLEDDDVDDESVPSGQEIILISDLQEGCLLEALHAYEWPSDTRLTVKQLKAGGKTNASLQLVTSQDSGSAGTGGHIRVRVGNSSDAVTDHFGLSWSNTAGDKMGEEVAHVTVMPGQSTVVRVPQPPGSSGGHALVLTGDDHDFDNTLYIAPPLERSTNIVYLGPDDPNDPQGMLYYLRRALEADNGLNIRVLARPSHRPFPTIDIEDAQMVVVTEPVVGNGQAALRRYLDSGRTLWLVLKAPADIETLAHLTGRNDLQAEEEEASTGTGHYSMLGRMDFSHPLLVPFAEPRFGDFTHIHFWRHRRVTLPEDLGARVLAHFDTGDPAWFEVSVGKGKLLVWTAAWHPGDSDLALSSKFVSLIYSILEYSGVMAARESQYAIGDAVPLPRDVLTGSPRPEVRKPDDSRVPIEEGWEHFSETDLPGLYQLGGASGSRVFAVNLPTEESRTAPLALDDLEKLGVRLAGAPEDVIRETEQTRLLTGRTEIESQQQIWRRIVLILLVALLIEIWLAGWLTRPVPLIPGEPT
ncbi:MAG: BatA domain-containing protein [Planctomycetes bacterium]|nr:BatA domain-containing protein [Planctomycetota bacterium]